MKNLKILIIQNKRIGDVLLSSLIARNIKIQQPNSHVDYFCYDYTAPVIENNPYIDNIIAVNANKLKNIFFLLKTAIKIRNSKYDIIIDPYSKFQSKFICFISNSKIRIGNRRKKKKSIFNSYTHVSKFKESASLNCGKSIEDRIALLNDVLPLDNPYYKPEILLTKDESNYKKTLSKDYIMIGVLGSVKSKSLPKEYMAKLIDKIVTHTGHNILFNYAPHQAYDAQEIYDLCKSKDFINFDLYEPDLRTFLSLLNKTKLLIANEGGSVHMAKALNIPTFTIYSPFINKESWNSFENLPIHDSVHLNDIKPELYLNITREKLKKIEQNPEKYYNQLTDEIIWKKLREYLELNFKK